MRAAQLDVSKDFSHPLLILLCFKEDMYGCGLLVVDDVTFTVFPLFLSQLCCEGYSEPNLLVFRLFSQ